MGGKSSTQKTENQPPAWAAPLFKRSASEATKLYNSGSGGNVYQGQTVADLGANTQAGIGSVMGGGADYGNLLQQAGQPTSASTNLGGMASGQNLLSNPYFNDALQGQLDSTAAQVQSQFSGAGRYGSGANTQALTSSLGNIRAGALSDQYNRDVGNMLTANQMIDNSNAQSLAGQLGVDQAQLGRSQAQVGAGQLQDQNAQQKLSADMARFYETDMQDWTRLGLLQSAAAGSAGNYGTSTQQQTQPFNALGGLGALGQMIFKSDARLKDDIEPVGVRNGHVLWEFAYKGTQGRYRGVMAQLVDEDAVVALPDGYLAVDYARLGLMMEAA